MQKTVLQIEGLSKLFRLGTIGTGSLRQDVHRWWKRSVLNEEDPFYKEMGSNSTLSRLGIWALKDVSFEVGEGEVFGIVGSNGAGKSTLLKIISRIIKPTKGVVRGKGKLSSLLEVGTGFHNELTGRENIYISGHILGMNKNEIRKKFDEIVSFSGVEQFIDTPVKRYSSGMYVRLGFAIAAHLEPDILIIDEVLAVGDLAFQKKCLGKMREVSLEKGRTILFVSHNMQAIRNLCSKALWLEKGAIQAIGETGQVVNRYIGSIQQYVLGQQWDHPPSAPGNEWVRIKSIQLVPHLANPADPIDIRTPLTVSFELWNLTDGINLCTGLHLFNQLGECIFDIASVPADFQKGILKGECHIPGNFLNDGAYYFSLIIVKDTSEVLFYYEQCLLFNMEDFRENMNWYGKWIGVVRPSFPHTLQQLTHEPASLL